MLHVVEHILSTDDEEEDSVVSEQRSTSPKPIETDPIPARPNFARYRTPGETARSAAVPPSPAGVRGPWRNPDDVRAIYSSGD